MNDYLTCVPIDSEGGDEGLQRIDHDPSDTPTRGAKEPRSHNAFTSPDGKFTANVWACDAGTLEIRNLAIDEACFIIEGTVTVEDLAGNRSEYGPGDAFLLPKGFSGTWDMPTGLRKFNTMYTR